MDSISNQVHPSFFINFLRYIVPIILDHFAIKFIVFNEIHCTDSTSPCSESISIITILIVHITRRSKIPKFEQPKLRRKIFDIPKETKYLGIIGDCNLLWRRTVVHCMKKRTFHIIIGLFQRRFTTVNYSLDVYGYYQTHGNLWTHGRMNNLEKKTCVGSVNVNVFSSARPSSAEATTNSSGLMNCFYWYYYCSKITLYISVFNNTSVHFSNNKPLFSLCNLLATIWALLWNNPISTILKSEPFEIMIDFPTSWIFNFNLH